MNNNQPSQALLKARELAELEKRATKGEWSEGRHDATSYDGDGYGPYKNVYVDDPNGKMHLGERLPKIVARGEGEECIENATFIAALRNAFPSILSELERLNEEHQKITKERDEAQKKAKDMEDEQIVIMNEQTQTNVRYLEETKNRDKEIVKLRQGYTGMREIISDDLSHEKSCGHDFNCICLQKRKEQALTSYPKLQ